ncbi:hypothetical protein FV222_01395 [Methylobacterium sp. WL103]|jgi:hypothetical protein|uniref:hypothetical protein n=1 Tax=unclassified Methylobacterium TaxID=2615210 RepID=UPI0011CB3308|nr:MULTISPECIES: hypothetical protein [unclassified Methylobacterium]TXN08030.1 hypothetical protein FV222_01395 [Methylobacterium sp. WL103]TXN15838.1 hypothetical protein FV219_01730 [Methylobacterium sp. WL122]TXN80351.1 hypothetical protein FV234_17335 [Methylobacterium sp. WL8]
MSLRRRSPALSPSIINTKPDRPGFRSFKTTSAVSYPRRWHRDLLIQATLDPSISFIEPVPAERQSQDSFKVFIWFEDRRRLLVAAPDAIDIGVYASLPDTLTLDRSTVLDEPRCSVARQIWATRMVQISPGDRIRILRELSESPGGVPLGRLIECVKSNDADSVDIVLALVCSGQAEVEVGSHLAPDTPIKRAARFQPLERGTMRATFV